MNVFDLGPGCAETPRRVAEVRDVAAAAQMARGGGLFYGGGGGYGGHGGFNAGGSSGGAAAANRSQRGRRLVHIALVSPAESTTVTLVAVCADGRRVYFTALPAGAERMGYPGMAGAATAAASTTNPYGGYAPAPARGGGASGPNGARRLVPAPTRLAVVASREPLPQGSAQRGMTSAQALRATTTARPLEVEAAYYGDGLMLLSDAADRDEDARLFMAARDLALPSHLQVTPANVTGAGGPGGVGGYVASSGLGGGASRSLRETVTAQQLAGRAASSVGSVGEVPPPARRDARPRAALPRRRPVRFGARAASSSKRTRHATRRAAPQVRHRHKRRHRPTREGAPAGRPVQAPRLGRARTDGALFPRVRTGGGGHHVPRHRPRVFGRRRARNVGWVRLRRRGARRDPHRRRERRVRSRRLPGKFRRRSRPRVRRHHRREGASRARGSAPDRGAARGRRRPRRRRRVVGGVRHGAPHRPAAAPSQRRPRRAVHVRRARARGDVGSTVGGDSREARRIALPLGIGRLRDNLRVHPSPTRWRTARRRTA